MNPRGLVYQRSLKTQLFDSGKKLIQTVHHFTYFPIFSLKCDLLVARLVKWSINY